MLDGFKILNPAWLATNVFTLWGGGGGKGGGGSAPAAPDYKAAAEATAKGNLDLAKYTTAANRINQFTPYGSLKYTNTPTLDTTAYNKALSDYNALSAKAKRKTTAPDQADYMKENWSATQELSPEQQALLEQTQGLSKGKLGYAQDILNKAAAGGGGVDLGGLPSYGINPGETYSDAIMRRLAPTQKAQQESFDAKMANQGVVPGTAAYDAAYRDFSQAQNDQLTSAIVGGMQTGLAANQQAYQQKLQNMNQPLNMINALQTGSQVQSPNFVNSYNMSTPQGADYVNAANQQYGAQLGQYNANQAANQNYWGGLMDLGSTAYSIFNGRGLFDFGGW